MIPPFKGTYPITQGFGVNKKNYEKYKLNGHNGLDWGTPLGTTLLASIGGNIFTGYDPLGYGRYVRIENNEFIVIIAHLSEFWVSNSIIVEGDVIGVSGGTGIWAGNSTGPHTHLTLKPKPVKKDNGYLGAVDPLPYLKHQDMTPEQFAELEKVRDKVIGLEENVGVLVTKDEVASLKELVEKMDARISSNELLLNSLGESTANIENLVKQVSVDSGGISPKEFAKVLLDEIKSSL